MRIALPLASLALLAAPSAAVAQLNPFQGQAPVPTTATPTVTVNPPANNSSSGGSLTTGQDFMIVGAGLLLLIGIGWAIVSDARNRAPVSDSELAHPGMGGRVRQNRSAKQRERARAKAKLGRAQRKRNRGRR
jgi:hypothetical protein